MKTYMALEMHEVKGLKAFGFNVWEFTSLYEEYKGDRTWDFSASGHLISTQTQNYWKPRIWSRLGWSHLSTIALLVHSLLYVAKTWTGFCMEFSGV